jgi:hypothetical protein
MKTETGIKILLVGLGLGAAYVLLKPKTAAPVQPAQPSPPLRPFVPGGIARPPSTSQPQPINQAPKPSAGFADAVINVARPR